MPRGKGMRGGWVMGKKKKGYVQIKNEQLRYKEEKRYNERDGETIHQEMI